MRIVVYLLTLVIATSSPAMALECSNGMQSRAVVELYFGRNIGEVLGVSEDAWTKFLDEEITPRFPDGLSVTTIAGQWKDSASGRIVREPGKVLTLIIEPDAATLAKIGEIIALYKVRHQQQSVLMTQQQVCAAF
jgi:Protein of unknown function (DUF3574)